jgi:hypothetical protein
MEITLPIKLDGTTDFDFDSTKEMVALESLKIALFERGEIEPPATDQELEREYWPFLVRRPS